MASAREAVPVETVQENPAAVAAITNGARIKAIWIAGKFGQQWAPGFRFAQDGSGRITAIEGKFLIFGDSRFLVRHYGTTKLIRSIEGRLARWGDPWFSFSYEAWSN